MVGNDDINVSPEKKAINPSQLKNNNGPKS